MARSTNRRVIAALLALTCLAAAPAKAPQRGVFALYGAKPVLRSLLTAHPSAGGDELNIVQYAIGSNVPVTRYDLDATQSMHLVVVRDDFRKFMHLHPVLHDNGHFTIAVALDAGHRFYAYADATPHGHSQQVYRFVLEAGVPPRKLDTSVAASSPSAAVGPYRVTLAATRIRANRSMVMATTIKRDGRIARDLHPYLGAAAHAVFIDTASLDYIHVHPVDSRAGSMEHAMAAMSAMPTLPANATLDGRMSLRIPKLARGAYKMWLQFRGGSTLYVAPFTIVAR